MAPLDWESLAGQFSEVRPCVKVTTGVFFEGGVIGNIPRSRRHFCTDSESLEWEHMALFVDGVFEDSKGYLRVSAGPQRGRRVHVMIAEAMVGRKLERHEVVHHRDGNKLNNDPANLEVMDVRKHNAVSAKQYWFLKKLELAERAEWDSWFGGATEPSEELEA